MGKKVIQFPISAPHSLFKPYVNLIQKGDNEHRFQNNINNFLKKQTIFAKGENQKYF